MKKIVVIIFLLLFIYLIFSFFRGPERLLDFSSPKNVFFNDNGLNFAISTSAATVDAFLQEQKINLSEHDQIIPERTARIFPATKIMIKRALKVNIAADGQKNDFWTLTDTVQGAIVDSRIALGSDDLVNPRLTAPLQKDLRISITRVEIREETVQKPIDFDTKATEDDSLGWRIKKVQQKGITGTKEIRYKVVTHDGQEISRKILAQNTIKEPTPEIIVQGTFMKLGKERTGQGTWYAFRGGLFAASTTLPRGAFAKVTNTANGQSVVVQINDYGPQGKGRIIDLDKVAFAKIASLGAGVIGVKVEQVLN